MAEGAQVTATDIRPMELGELLDRTFNFYRRNFVLFVGIMLIPQLFALAMTLIWQNIESMAQGASPSLAQVMQALAAFFIVLALFVVFWVVYSLALGASALAVSDVFLSRPTSVRSCYGRVSARFWPLIGLVFAITLRVFGVFFASFILFALFMGVAAAAGGAGGAMMAVAGFLFIILGFVGGGILALWLAVRYSVAVPALILEAIPAREAIRRSVHLTKGHRGKVLVVVLLASVVAYAAIAIFQGPFFVAGVVMAKGGQPPLWLMNLSAIFGSIGGALTSPVMMIGLSLLYYDLRIRKEALDLELMMANLSQPAAPAGGPTPA